MAPERWVAAREQAQAIVRPFSAARRKFRRGVGRFATGPIHGYGVEVGVLDDNPVTNVKRPRVNAESMSVGLARDELERLLDAADADGPGRRR